MHFKEIECLQRLQAKILSNSGLIENSFDFKTNDDLARI